MSITKSDLPNCGKLDQQAMFTEAWWLNYCFCFGRAIGDIGNPYFASDGKNLCLRSTCQMVGIGDPFCSQVSVTCCITSQCQFPAMPGSPTCVCFNKTLAAGAAKGGESDWRPDLFDYTANFKDTFWLYYFLCAGVGCSGLSANGRPLYAMQQKQLCISQGVRLVPPVENGVLCSGLGTALCCWTQLEIPPAPNNPKFKCCGFPKGGSNAKPMAYGKPGQAEMA